MTPRAVHFRVRPCGSRSLVASAAPIPRQPAAFATEGGDVTTRGRASRARRPGVPPRHRAREARTAYHEAGHAVAAFVLGVPILEVTVEPSGPHAGYVRLGPRSATSAEDRAVAIFAGAAAVSRLLGVEVEPSSGDIVVVDDVLGLSRIHPDKALPLELRLEARARELVAEHWHLVEMLAEELTACGTLSGRALRRLLSDED